MNLLLLSTALMMTGTAIAIHGILDYGPPKRSARVGLAVVALSLLLVIGAMLW